MRAFVFALLFFATHAYAQSFDGHYDLLKGGRQCPSGSVQTRGKRLMFGSRHVWLLEDSKEKVEAGCSYETKIKKFDNQVEITTFRSSCPNKVENGETRESLQLQKGILVYSFSDNSQNKKNEFQCVYMKVKAK